jgi:hypothetical protein
LVGRYFTLPILKVKLHRLAGSGKGPMGALPAFVNEADVLGYMAGIVKTRSCSVDLR